MEKKFKKSGKLKAFFKRNAYYLIMAVCIAAIGTMVTIAIVNNNNNTTPVDGDPIEDPGNVVNPGDEDPGNVVNPGDEDPGKPVIKEPMIFCLPVADAVIIKDYSMDMIVWHKTLRQYSVHDGINYGGAENAAVVSAFAGTVESVTYDEYNGHMIVIKHADDIKTTYSSLGSVSVAAGQAVTKGQAIGTIGISSSKEMLEGPHVHFVVTRNGAITDPYEFLPEGSK